MGHFIKEPITICGQFIQVICKDVLIKLTIHKDPFHLRSVHLFQQREWVSNKNLLAPLPKQNLKHKRKQILYQMALTLNLEMLKIHILRCYYFSLRSVPPPLHGVVVLCRFKEQHLKSHFNHCKCPQSCWNGWRHVQPTMETLLNKLTDSIKPFQLLLYDRFFRFYSWSRHLSANCV